MDTLGWGGFGCWLAVPGALSFIPLPRGGGEVAGRGGKKTNRSTAFLLAGRRNRASSSRLKSFLEVQLVYNALSISSSAAAARPL